MNTKDSNFEVALVGETIVSVVGAKVGSDTVEIKTQSGRTFRMYHEQDCCESVTVVRAYIPYIGNGLTIVSASEKIESIPSAESATRTTFVFETSCGIGFIEWIGESNGFYSESVSFVEDKP